jgi:hypothetical protein
MFIKFWFFITLVLTSATIMWRLIFKDIDIFAGTPATYTDYLIKLSTEIHEQFHRKRTINWVSHPPSEISRMKLTQDSMINYRGVFPPSRSKFRLAAAAPVTQSISDFPE